jgi:hypothetical protein
MIVLWLALGCGGPAESVGKVELPSQGPEADLAAARAFYASRPPYERPLDEGLRGVKGLGEGLSAEGCATCHAEIAAEWRTSIHAHAWVDPQFQAELDKGDHDWLCRNCHAPLLVQQAQWAVGLLDEDVQRPLVVNNLRFDARLREEGITCLGCHLRGDHIVGPGLGGEPPHEVEADPEWFRSGALCQRCHQAEATYPGKNFVCTFNTGVEWAGSPAAREGKACPDCHMPAVERPAATGGPVRTVRRHWFRGAGIPKVGDIAPPPEARTPGLALNAETAGGELILTLTNAEAGHRLPSGDPERWIQVDVGFLDAAGGDVGHHELRIGQVWTWGPPTKVSDNRLDPGESRREAVPWPDSAVRAVLVASHHRMSEDNARYHGLLGTYPLSIETHRLEIGRSAAGENP